MPWIYSSIQNVDMAAKISVAFIPGHRSFFLDLEDDPAGKQHRKGLFKRETEDDDNPAAL